MNYTNSTELDGRTLTPDALSKIASGAPVHVVASAFDRMSERNSQLLAAIARGAPIYGVTTGLGPKVVQSLSEDEINVFSRATIRGRAHAVSDPLPHDIVRAGMAVRLNSILCGATGASPNVARHILDCLNADLVPHIGGTGSIGPADLMWGGNFALALIGEGRFLGQKANETSASRLTSAGIKPLTLGPRDGLALVSHSGFSTAIAALALADARHIWAWAQSAAALSLEGFQANLSPFRADVLALGLQTGAEEAGRDLLNRMKGSALFDASNARRLQDPLSFRNIAQVHGSLFAALDVLENCVTQEMNGASDSPVLVGEGEDIVSTGNFLNPYLSVALVGTNHAMVQLAAQITARVSRLLSARFTDLTNGLNDAAAGNAGLGPVSKVSEALFAEIAQLSSPPPVYPSSSADGVEDTINFAAPSALNLRHITSKMASLIAIELVVAVQAVELRNDVKKLPSSLREVADTVRGIVAKFVEDRPLGAELDALSKEICATTV